MTKTIKYSNDDVEGMVVELTHQMAAERWIPDYIVGITGGGSQVALLLSQYFSVPMESLKVDILDGNTETNCWMSEDACGWGGEPIKNILIVSDVNLTGEQFQWIKDDWEKSVRFDECEWEKIWNNTTRFAVLVDDVGCPFKVDYSANECNVLETPTSYIFPWNEWWKKWK